MSAAPLTDIFRLIHCKQNTCQHIHGIAKDDIPVSKRRHFALQKVAYQDAKDGLLEKRKINIILKQQKNNKQRMWKTVYKTLENNVDKL